MVVHSEDGLDEISPSGRTHAWIITGGQIEKTLISPADFGLKEHSLDAVRGSTPQQNAQTFMQLIDSKEAEGPIADYVVLNAAAALFVGGHATDLRSAAELARDTIRTGKAAHKVRSYISLSQHFSKVFPESN